jgi:hypothetical protein
MVCYNKTMYEGGETLLEQTYAIVKENNRLLKGMRRSARIGIFFKILFWAAILGVPVWIYFTIAQPIIQQSLDALNQVQTVTGQVQNLPQVSTDQLQRLLDLLPNIDIGAITGEQ